MTPARPLPAPQPATPPDGWPRPGGAWAGASPLQFQLCKDRLTYQAPVLTDPAALAAHGSVLTILRAVQRALADRLAGRVPAPVALDALGPEERALLEQLLGAGEVSARVTHPTAGDGVLLAQEAVFAGVWRVRQRDAAGPVDAIEVAPVPQGLLDAARLDAYTMVAASDPPAADTLHAPALLQELRDHARTWRTGDPAHVVNLTLLPLSDGDHAFLRTQLAAGRVQILSRGYGHCRIVNTRLPRTWRVSYFNAAEQVVLDTFEVALVPEVACAATQDLEDSAERLGELLAWLEGSA